MTGFTIGLPKNLINPVKFEGKNYWVHRFVLNLKSEIKNQASPHGGIVRMRTRIRIGDQVTLVDDMPDKGLFRGQVGMVVQEYDPGVYDVEFRFLSGREQVVVTTLRAGMLMPLHPVENS